MVLNFTLPQYCEFSKESCLFNMLMKGKKNDLKQAIQYVQILIFGLPRQISSEFVLLSYYLTG